MARTRNPGSVFDFSLARGQWHKLPVARQTHQCPADLPFSTATGRSK